MKCYVRWIFVVLLMCSLTSFMGKDKHSRGLEVGDIAPDIRIKSISKNDSLNQFTISQKQQFTLLSFWASYDGSSRMKNASLNNFLNSGNYDVKMVSIAFDNYSSVFAEAIKRDQIMCVDCYLEELGTDSEVYKKFKLNQGFTHYLLDEDGVIVAKNISAANLADYVRMN